MSLFAWNPEGNRSADLKRVAKHSTADYDIFDVIIAMWVSFQQTQVFLLPTGLCDLMFCYGQARQINTKLIWTQWHAQTLYVYMCVWYCI